MLLRIPYAAPYRSRTRGRLTLVPPLSWLKIHGASTGADLGPESYAVPHLSRDKVSNVTNLADLQPLYANLRSRLNRN